MYEAMRQRAPFSPRAIGASTTILLASAAGYVLLTGFGAAIVKAVQRPMVMAMIPARPVPPEHTPPPVTPDETQFPLPMPPPPTTPNERFFAEDNPGEIDPGTSTGPKIDPVVPPSHVLVRIAPKMKPMPSPPYPAAAVRAGMQGTSSIDLCIDAKGRVTSASLARSSGHDVLDQAALKWVREARFAPGTADGAAQSVCGHPVDYVWNLETLRR